jgi:ABC-type polysaccharide/polyol phosphate export permease
MIGLLIRFVVCVLVLEFFGFKIPISYMVLAYILIAIFSFSYAIILSTLMHEMLFLKELHQYFLTFLFFTSSILIPVPLLPEPIRGILLYNPLVHYFEWIKVPVTNVEYSFIDINYFLSFLLIMFLLSPLFLFYKQKNYL